MYTISFFVISPTLSTLTKTNITPTHFWSTCHFLTNFAKVACEAYNLATTAGHNASTGCGGLILQGGHGFLETWTEKRISLATKWTPTLVINMMEKPYKWPYNRVTGVNSPYF